MGGDKNTVDALTQRSMADIASERAATSFPIGVLAVYVDRGRERHEARKAAHSLIARDSAIAFSADASPFDLARKQLREKTNAQVQRVRHLCRHAKDALSRDALLVAACELSESLGMKLYVHDALYVASINLFGTPEQIAYFLPPDLDPRVNGCFAMTELGHSSSLQDLETTATYVPETREWSITSPTITSTKWWIGGAGGSATHAVMVSQTSIKGTSYGLAWFIVQLRSIEDGRLLPGVVCGDVGAKAGRNGLDNGWIQLTGVRVPLNNMLMKWMQVDEEGNVSPPPHPAVMYATLIPERISSLTGIKILVAQSVTIACRYGVTRRQGPGNPQIIDFQAQTVNMLPLVAGIYVYMNTEKRMEARWNRLQIAAAEDPDTYLKELPDIHCISAGLKAVGTWWGSHAFETCRRACGGHAYSSYNAIAGHIDDWGVFTTGGGDNFALIQQLSRYVFTCVKSVLSSNGQDANCFGSAKFINNAPQILRSGFKFPNTPGAYSDLKNYVNLFAYLVVKKAADLISQFAQEKKKSPDTDVWNLFQSEMMRLGALFVYQYIFELYLEELEDLKNSTSADSQRILPVLTQCGLLFAGDLIRREVMDSVLEEGCMTREQSQSLRRTVYQSAKELRANVIGLTDAFGFPDFILKAPIGRYDGDIYREYFKIVSNAPDCFKTPYFESEVKPLLVRSQL